MTDSVQIIGSKGTGGAENFFARLTLALNQTGNKVLAITPPDCPTQQKIEKTVAVTPVAMRGNWDIFSSYRIKKLVKQTGFPIVQTWMGRATRLTNINSLSGVIHVARLGGYYNLKSYRHADAWVGNTKGICDYLIEQGMPLNRVFHISNFYQPAPTIAEADLLAARNDLGIEAGAAVLFALGRLHINKGFDVLLKAFNQLLKSQADRSCYLLIAGDGPLRNALHSTAKELGLDSRIKWLGWVDQPALYFQLADVFICPSRHEPLGNVVLEAWGNQTPVVASNSQGPAELITPGQNGLLVDNENSEQMCSAIQVLLSQPGLADELASAGKQLLEKNFSCEKITHDYLQLYADLCASN
jgi:glycosyltransferase involved in cell wall biosynthesis